MIFCMFISYGKDVCTHRHTFVFFRCLRVEHSVCMCCNPMVQEPKIDNTL
jgi:hypothetical protein